MRPKKSLGQNFLTNEDIAKQIAGLVPPGNNVLEIGPGHGALTKYLIPPAKTFTAIDLDKTLIDKMQALYSQTSHRFIHADILQTDISALAGHNRVFVVGNIPYYITTPIIFHILAAGQSVEGFVLMMQKEVAERIVARSGNKQYGILSIMTQLQARVTYELDVPASEFYPQPKVDSAVVRFEIPDKPLYPDCDHTNLSLLVRQAFGQRRKMLRGTLKAFPLEKTNVDLTLRPEDLSIEQWIQLTNDLFNQD
jgi:16S rRNA (adenine1518-N6/adenine1519-N6)-dimethyltransferase